MKKILTSISLCCLAATLLTAQNLITKVPSNASVVIKYAGENFTTKVPLQKIDSYGFIKNNFFKMLHLDTLTSLQHTGINFEQDAYQYITMEDSSLNFVTVMHLKNLPPFLQLIKANYGATITTVQKNGYSMLPVSATTYVGWSDKMAMIVNTTYQNKKNYYDWLYRSNNDSTVAVVTSPVAEEVVIVTDTTVKFNPPKIVKTKPVKPIVKAKPKTPVKRSPEKNQPSKKEMEEIAAKEQYRIQDSITAVKKDLWEQQQEMIAKAKQEAVAEKIMGTAFTGSIISIENEVSYKKIIDPVAHASVWFNAENISAQYFNYFNRGMYSMLGNTIKYTKDTAAGFRSSVNIYFDKDKMRMEQKTFSSDAKMAAMGAAVMNSKQNESIINYVNPGNIGYFSMSINTEAMANYYYTLMKQYISNTPYLKEYGDIVDVYIDLLEIMIDEKGIADMMPGNFLFVMHDLKTKQVSYTDYEFDKEFNRKEIKKTKSELSPNFTFVMETKKEGFMEKLAHLPIKYAEKEKFNYKDKGGYNEYTLDSGKYPISSLYFMVKNGKAVVTTSKEAIDLTINNTGFATDAVTKNSILNNNYSLNISTKKILEKMGSEFSAGVNKKIGDYLLANMGDIKMESSLKDGIIQGTTTMSINGNHANSLEFFFNMMDAINNIIEKEKQEQEKKVD